MRGRNEAKGDSRWGQIEEKGFDTLSRYGFREWSKFSMSHTGKAHVGTSVAEDLRQTRKAELRFIFKRPPIGISSLLLPF